MSSSYERHGTQGGLVQLGYNWSRTMDVMSMAGFIGTVIFRSNPVDGSLAHRILRRSARRSSASSRRQLFRRCGAPRCPLSFERGRAPPYASTVSGDANADGTPGNDLACIPRDVNDLSVANPAVYPALPFIRSESCLRRQRGRIMTRNSSGLIRETSSREDVPLTNSESANAKSADPGDRNCEARGMAKFVYVLETRQAVDGGRTGLLRLNQCPEASFGVT